MTETTGDRVIGSASDLRPENDSQKPLSRDTVEGRGGTDAMKPERYYTITDRRGGRPWALLRVGGGLYERWVDQQGWVDMPYFAAYFNGGEYGAAEITKEQAVALQAEGLVGKPGAAGAELLRGAP